MEIHIVSGERIFKSLSKLNNSVNDEKLKIDKK